MASVSLPVKWEQGLPRVLLALVYSVCCFLPWRGPTPSRDRKTPASPNPGLAGLTRRGWVLAVACEAPAEVPQREPGSWLSSLQTRGPGDANSQSVGNTPSWGPLRTDRLPPSGTLFLCAGVWDQKGHICPTRGQPLPWEGRGC